MRELGLNKRIELLAQTKSELGTLLMAVKWIGNEGSHGTKIPRDQVLDAYEILELGLAMAFERRDKVIMARAKKIARPRKKIGPV